jgi:CubicO group peptidase (beta-lactamase class C family)
MMRTFGAKALILMSVLLSTIALAVAQAPAPAAQTAVTNMEELSAAIDEIRLRTNTPGLAVGVIREGQANWQYYSGLANLQSKTPLSENSQFRFGSISKMFVALSVLKLAEQGKLSLNDKVSKVAPEIEFSNPWEASHPLKIVHLLNHSSGWDSPHFAEQKTLALTPVAIIDVLNAHPHSRKSRWQPGSRIAYNNTGFLAAAYIIEKATGETFESYVASNFFAPLSMTNSGYYFSDTYRESAVTLYVNGQQQQYRHLNNRAAGGLNGTIGDMLKFAQFLISKQTTNILRQEALDLFRKPTGTRSSELGIDFSWGLGNQLFHANGTLLYGHEGSLRGANAMLIYNPVHKFAYVIAANSNSPALSQVHRLLSHYLTKDINVPNVVAERKLNHADKAISGWYKNAAPISAVFSIASTIVPWKLHISDEASFIKPLFGSPPRQLIADATNGFKQNTSGLRVLLPVQDEMLGELVYYGPQTLVKTNIVSAFLPLFILVYWLVMSMSAFLFLCIWLPRYIFKKSISAEAIVFRLWPLVSLGFALIAIISARITTNSPTMHVIAGSITPLSVLIFMASIGFFLSAIWAVWTTYKNSKTQIHGFTKWHTVLFTLANAMLAMLLLVNGLVGLRLWA